MKTSVLAIVALGGVVLASVAVLADDAAKPIRHLRYDVVVGVRNSRDVNSYSGHAVLGGEETQAKGSITADVVGVAADKALIFRVSEDTDLRRSGPTQVGVLKDGQLSYDPKDQATLLAEELLLASLLGRAVVADHDLSAGTEWSASYKNGGYSSETTYRVDGLQGDNEVDLDIQRTVKVTGVQAQDTLTTGRIRYDYKRSVVLSGRLQEHTHYADVDSNRTTADLSFDYTLADDSMAPKP
jgi:hypothetical protein